MNYDYCVCVDAGQFDIVLDRFSTAKCADGFVSGTKEYCKYPLVIKPATDVRELIVGYTNDRIITSTSIETGNEQ